jgi:hypothetical protein
MGARFPLTIREVVRRGREDAGELDRLRAEVDHLRRRAEAAEDLLRAGDAPAHRADPPTRNGRAPENGHVRPAEHHVAYRDAASPSAWAPAAVFPRGPGARPGPDET